VYAKLQQLNNELDRSASKTRQSKFIDVRHLESLNRNYKTFKDLDRLESMMQAVKEGKETDPEIEQLNHILDKILAIQQPESMSDSINKIQYAGQKSYRVRLNSDHDNISLMQPGMKAYFNDSIVPVSINEEHNYFYSFDNASENNSGLRDNTIKAVIPETQTLVAGSTVKLLLSSDIKIKETSIPKNTFIYDIASLNNERLKINVSSIRYEDNLFPVSLEVYDLDGLAGICMPGSISKDVIKQSTDQALGGIGITTLDRSVAAHATSAGSRQLRH